MDNWPHQNTLTLAAMPNSAYWARRHTEDLLGKWEIPGVTANALLVVSELVTNAVKVTKSFEPELLAAYSARPISTTSAILKAGVSWVQLRLSYDYIRLLIEVWDKSDKEPQASLPDFESESGRGLFVVGAYCERWGWCPDPGGGKWVWGEISLPQQQRSVGRVTGRG